MKILIASVLLLCCSTEIIGQSQYQLATPLMKFESVFFSKQASVDLKFNFTGSQIRYTLDGSEPTESGNLYRSRLSIRKSFTTLKARVFSKGYQPSEIVSATFIKDGIKVQKAEFPIASQRFPGSGPATLIDNKGGHTSIGNATWLGYQDDSVDVVLTLQKTSKVKQVLVDLLEDHGNWVFLPEKIEVFYTDPGTGQRRPFGKLITSADKIISGARCEFRIIEADQTILTNNIIIRLSVLKSMPATHPGNGKKSWIFIDEIKVY